MGFPGTQGVKFGAPSCIGFWYIVRQSRQLYRLTPQYNNLADRIERVERQFTKHLAGLKKMSYRDRLRVLGLESLERIG